METGNLLLAGADQGHRELSTGNSRESTVLKFPAGLPRNFVIFPKIVFFFWI